MTAIDEPKGTTRAIKLPRGVWNYNPFEMLGRPGGFGAVFAGVAECGDIAVKKLHRDAGALAHRELLIADELIGRSFTNVIPVLDAGQDAESLEYFVVMPRGKGNLRQTMTELNERCPNRSLSILLEIVNGLIEVNTIVHRDLKPENVLQFNGHWCVADFGIARFVEDATSLNTLKGCLTPHYAAPELWELKHATNATDVYALGCVAYEMLAGRPPFVGDKEDLRQQHCHADPDSLPPSIPGQLRSLVTMMLRKSPAARPSLARIKQQLEAITRSEDSNNETPKSLKELGDVSAAIAHQEAERDVEKQRLRLEATQRKNLRIEAELLLFENFKRLSKKIETGAPNAIVRSGVDPSVLIQLGEGELSMLCFQRDIPANTFPRSKWDVIASAKIEVHQKNPKYHWSCSLWYARLPKSDEFRWYEVGYSGNALMRSSSPFVPFSLGLGTEADEAGSGMISLIQIAFGPVPIDDENETHFHDRWIQLFTKACAGLLCRPRQVPIPLESV